MNPHIPPFHSVLRALLFPAAIAIMALGFSIQATRAATQDGALRMEVITAYNFVVDSNIESPAGNSPSAAHLGVRIYNDGATALTNVVVNIGKLANPLASAGTPGAFDPRTVAVTGQYAGTFSLQMPGGSADATRIIPRIEPGDHAVQYFFVTYPLKDSLGRSVTGASSDPTDDLWLNYDMWASANDGVTTRRVDKTNKVTMRNEISAMANKIWPNTTSKVPDQYLSTIEAALGWRPDSSAPRVPGASVAEGIWYDLGNVGAGFDNNGDGIPDRNAWLQPVGNPSRFSPLAARLVKCYGIVIVKLNDGTERLIPFEDRLYFENLPANNTGAIGLVYYEFLPLNTSLPISLSPYQEVASGYDNEKFNADYGTVTVNAASAPPTAQIVKTGPATRLKGQAANYTLTATNTGAVPFGWPDLGLPVVIEDPIPSGLQYVSGSAITGSNVTTPSGGVFAVHYSTDNGSTWSATEPVPSSSVNRLRWVLDRPLAPGNTAAVVFSALVPTGFSGLSFNNTGLLKTGTESEVARSTWLTIISGNNSIGDFVWRDLDRDGVQDGGLEVGIPNVGVTLYVDANGDGVLNSGDTTYGSASTSGTGGFLFSNLPDAKYIVVVATGDPDVPAGFTLKGSTSDRFAVDLDSGAANPNPVNFLTADWPFIQALEVTKSVSPSTYLGGDLINYTIDLDNHMATLQIPQPNVRALYANTTAFSNSNAQDKANEARAAGAPNNIFTYVDSAASSDRLVSAGVTPSFALPGGASITKVELIVRGYMSVPFVDDQFDIQIGHSDRSISNFVTRTTAQMNALVGVAQDLVIDVTGASGATPGWTAAEINSLSAALVSNKTGSGDTGDYYVDSIGFRVTTDNAPFAGSGGPNTIAQWPLVDTYDPGKLEFVSASVTPDLASPPGRLEWYNLGPVNAGARKSITVTFRAKSPTDTNADGRRDPMVATNTVNTTGSSIGEVPRFQSGLAAGHDDGAANVTINPAGRIGDLVYWDVNANGSFGAGDFPISGVIAQLYQNPGSGFAYTGRSEITDSNGFYEFNGLVDGTYQIRITTATANDLYSLPWATNVTSLQKGSAGTNQTGYVQGDSVAINNTDFVPANDSSSLQDFGFDTNSASLVSGKLFRDWDGDGVQDPGDEPLAGVTVSLTGNVRTTTDANGFYQFTNLTNAVSSTVTVTPPSGHDQSLDPDGTANNATTINVSLGTAYPNQNFAYRPSGSLSIGDTLYYDWDGNGTKNAGENGIANVEILLFQDDNGDGVINATDALVSTTYTDAGGVYQFAALSAGNYIVEVNVADPDFPAAHVQTQDYDTLFDDRAKVSLAASISSVDFGYRPIGTTTLGNLVWLDANNNGLKDAVEPGIDGVVVQLYRSTQVPGVDAPTLTTVTSGGGFYSFANLPANSYYVYVPQSNYGSGKALEPYPWSSTVTVTIDSQVDGDDNGIQVGSGSATVSPLVTLSVSESDQTVDFGFTGTGSAGDLVFYDGNGNGNQDFTETGIPGVTVRIFADANLDGSADGSTPVATAVTSNGSDGNPVGFYQFNGLFPGMYFIKVDDTTLPAGVTLTSDPDRDGIPVGSPPANPIGDGADSLVYIASGASYAGGDFGYEPLGAIGDFVWLDLNQDGLVDAGEPGIPNVAIRLTNGVTTFDVFTDPDGYWSAIVADGTWSVTVLPSNFNVSGPLENRLPTFDADGTGTANAVSLVLSGGAVASPNALAEGNLGVDFGYRLDGAYDISGTILTNDTRTLGTADDIDDFADDGVDMDAGALDETELVGVPIYLYAGGGSFLGTTTTDASGNYSFSGLPAGSYRVIIGTTQFPLNAATLTTTAANNPAVSSVNSSSGTSVIQTVAVNGSNVSDVDFAFISTVDYDFGDLPLSYGMTTLGDDGARHTIPAGGSTLYLGSVPDKESNGIVNSQALGDDLVGTDDEDGISPVAISSWTDGTGGNLIASVTGRGWLVGWIDWNNDNDFLDANEMVVSQAVDTGSIGLSFNIPAGTVNAGSQSWLSRFRLFNAKPAFPLFSYVGEATDGEVEDHLLQKTVGGSIGDLVWADTNGNGSLDGMEAGLAGVLVELRDSSNLLVASQTTSNGNQDVDNDGLTDPVGYYRFTNLAAGTYNIVVPAPPAAYLPSHDGDGTGTPNATQFALASGVQHLTADFGYQPLFASISGQVRFDLDSDGDLSDVDLAASSVSIQLWTDPNGDGNPSDGVQVGEASTDSSGNYTFSNVPTGNYVVVEINPAGAASTADVDGGNPDRITVALVGANVTGRDFLDSVPPGYLGSIGDFVFTDLNANGQQDEGETGLDGVSVSVFRPGFGKDGIAGNVDDAAEVATTTTASGGAYGFNGLPPGDYRIEFGALSGYIRTPADQGADATDSDADPITGLTATFAIAAGASNNTVDAGYHIPGTVSGHLYIDSNGNGSQDSGEPNLAGVDVLITDVNGGTQTVSTDGSGNWTATVPPGSTTANVDETDPQFPTGHTQSEGTDPTSVTAVAGTDTTTGNDGYSPDLDSDDDGIPDTLEVASSCNGGDTDGDGVPDVLDLDSDGDGIFDVVEAGNGALDADLDGIVDGVAGANGLPNAVETLPDSGVVNYTLPDRDSDGRPDQLDLDSDNDSISDVLESGNGGLVDSQNDGLADGAVSSSGTVVEAGLVMPADNDTDLQPDYLDVDSDGDGVFDIVDNGFGSLDANGNGIIDNSASPADCDGIADALDPQDDVYGWFPEMGCMAWNLRNPFDTDEDVFPKVQEYVFGVDPLLGYHRVIGTARHAGMTIEKNLTGGVDISYVRPAGRFDAVVTPYVSPDPRVPNDANWTAVTAPPSITDNGDGTQTIKWADIHDIDGNAAVTRDRGFVRLLVATSCEPAGSWTLVQGWCRETIAGKRQTYGVNFSSMPVFTGYVDSASGSAVTSSTSGKGQNLGTYLAGGAPCYIEFTDGPQEGHRFDIASGGVDTFNLNLASLNNTRTTLPVDLAGSHYVVRRHDTLGGIYPNAQWDASTTPGSADQVLLYSGSGYDTYFNLSLGSVWAKQGAGFGSQNGLVIAPGTGMLVVHANPADTNEMLAFGDLRYNDFRRPVKLGTSGLNLTSLGFPFDETPGTLNMTATNGFVAAVSPGSSTQILNWVGDSVANTTGWTTNFQLFDGNWRTQGNIAVGTTNSPLFRHCRAAHVDVQVDQLNWTHILPWNPAPWVQPAQ